MQVEAGKKYGYTPERTLELIQSLYEKHKLISFPRTDGRYVSSEKSKDFPMLLNAVKAMPEFTDFVKNIQDFFPSYRVKGAGRFITNQQFRISQ